MSRYRAGIEEGFGSILFSPLDREHCSRLCRIELNTGCGAGKNRIAVRREVFWRWNEPFVRNHARLLPSDVTTSASVVRGGELDSDYSPMRPGHAGIASGPVKPV